MGCGSEPHKIIVVALLLGADVAHATSPWPPFAPPRAPNDPLACATRAETVLDAQQRAQRLERELGALRGGEVTWSGELANEDSDEDDLEEQLAAAHELIAWANSSDFTCAVGCRHTDADTCAACPAAYDDVCSAFGGCDPNGAAINATEDDVTCTCLEGFLGRRCSGKELGGGAIVGLVLFGLLCVVIISVARRRGRGVEEYPECTEEANSQVKRILEYFTKLLIVLQLNEPPFSPNEQFGVDYGLPKIPPWLSAISFDFAEVEGWDWKAQFWLFNGMVIAPLFVGLLISFGYRGGDPLSRLAASASLHHLLSLLTVPVFRVNTSFWLECTTFDGTNEMRWQMAAVNATTTDTIKDGLFFEVTEEELYATGVSANFFDQSPAESCRESSMLMYGLGAIAFGVCGGLAIIWGVVGHSRERGACKPKPNFSVLYAVFKVRAAFQLIEPARFSPNSCLGADHKRVGPNWAGRLAQKSHVVLHRRAQPAPCRHHSRDVAVRPCEI
eukprot:COSAG01_NODE_4962_length_4588_cov_6.072845_5_plen_502_part_00